MSVTPDNLARANASFRRGARPTVAVLLFLSAALLVYWSTRGFRGFRIENITDRSITAWLTILVLLGLLLYLVREAVQSSRTYLTRSGIQRGDEVLVQWSEITVAEYSRPWLRFEIHERRHVALTLMFASSANAILEAVQDHLPAGVRLRVH